MLTNSSVLEAIKFSLGFPFTEIELLDEDIIYRVKNILLKRYFSPFVPVYKFKVINTTDTTVTTSTSNRYKIIDEDEAGILSVFEVIDDTEIYINSGIIGSQGVSYSELPAWYESYIAKRTTTLTTNWYSIYQFIHPMYIEIRPKMTIAKKFMVCYEAQHTSFETIPTYRESLFLDYAIGYIKKSIAEIRSKYETIGTSFGEVKLNWERLENDGKELFDRTTERLNKIPPRVIIGIG